MRAYTVHAPPGADIRDPAAAERFAFVKDGFSWPALLFPVLWILWRRLWLTLVWYVAFVLALMWIGRLAGENVAAAVGLIGAVLFALEANNIRRWSLGRRGWRDVGASHGKNLQDAEMRFFGGWDRPSPANQPSREQTVLRSSWTPPRPAASDEQPVLGLFPEADR